ncbi:hypothetical protein MPTK1_3g02930 [Marchantia polymorpha subsp. ruderalis]|uniref:VPS28 C-terminal domain-containing protein n=2 Tax=Marchantia polymorpha TaxID=3197 RepID=A0AAF6AWV9_MARPO|nr:hypothetical protein MARPO_0007s0281 [Marchantia polymorpha]BBN04243.1 hypothetical protein Mp_3g02930 [Marchantia polymorpha subsp. ruderalis]|eukprot:PTQ47929.1 hypothetical protein MARPO_0007s0281 [Marchantia polymorpha]
MISEKPWVAHIEDEINSLVDLDPRDRVRGSIFRVPPSVRRVKPHLYSPQIIPFGLYNVERIRSEKMSRMDRLKLEVASRVLKIIKAPYTECYQHYDAALDCLSLPRVTPNQLHPILADLVAALSRLPYVSTDSEGKLEMMRGRIAHLRAMAQAPGYELRERESKLLSADLDSVFQVFARFLELNSESNRKNWKWLCNKVVGDAAVMEIYDDVSDVYEGAARSLLTLDAVFLVAFMLSLHSGPAPESRILIEELGWFNPVLDVFRQEGVRCNAHEIGLDMWLMENQIPLAMIRSALECMWEVSNQAGGSASSDRALVTLVRHAVKGVLHLVPGDCSKHTTSIDAVPIPECKHLLECLYRVVCPSVKTSGGSRRPPLRRHARAKPSGASAADFAARSRGLDARPSQSAASSRADIESRYPSASATGGVPLLAPSPSCPNYPRLPPELQLYPPAHSSSFPGFQPSPPSSPTAREPSAPASHPNKQYDNAYHQRPPSHLVLAPPPLPTSIAPSLLPFGAASGYHKSEAFRANGVTHVLANGETREMDRYGRSNGHGEPAAPSGWSDSAASPVGTDDELELPFRAAARRSPTPLPVSDVAMLDDGMNQVEFTLADSRGRNNSYSAVTIDIPGGLPVGKRLLETARAAGGHSGLTVSSGCDGGPAGYVSLGTLRSASLRTIRTIKSARSWAGAPWRLVRRILARVGAADRNSRLGHKVPSRAAFTAPRASQPLCSGGSDTRITPVPSVSQLRKAGIGIRSGSQVGCKLLLGEGGGCGFIKPTLFLPKLEIDASTERILQNLVAFELVSASEHELMSYLHFMNGLIKTEEDVQWLQRGNKAVIWIHPLSSEFEVVTMFGSLLQNCYFLETGKSRHLRRELSKCYSRSWRHRFASFVDVLCTRSWILISLIVATLILVVLQTAYMLLGFYRLVD